MKPKNNYIEDDLVSVCIPVYNCEKYVKKCIESVINQSYKNIEIIIINNNSTDNTEAIVKGIKDNRIKYYKNQSTIILTENWNKCFKYSSGKYIKILCADDLINNKYIENMVEIFNSKRDIGIIFSNLNFIDDKENKILISDRNFRNSFLITKGNKFIKDIICCKKKIFSTPTSWILKSECLKQVKGFTLIKGNECCIDLEFISRVLINYDGFFCSNKLASYRLHSEQGTYTYFKEPYKVFSVYLNTENYILKEAKIKINNFEKYLMKLDIFRSGIRIAHKNHTINFKLLRYLIKNYGFMYFMAFLLPDYQVKIYKLGKKFKLKI